MRIRLQGSGHAARLLAELNRCRLSRLLCDVVLQVGGRTFPAHRAVLACSCTHFHSLFSQASRHGSTPNSTGSFSLDFVSPTNFEKVLTFIYTGEIFTDLIDVRVLYELAERLGVRELVQACHATFPDLQSSSLGLCGGGGGADRDRGRELDGMEASTGGALVSAASACSSSAASCSSLSSSAVPTPVTPSPLPQARASRLGHLLPHAASASSTSSFLCISPKAEDSAHGEYGSQVEHGRASSGAMHRSEEQAEPGGGPVLALQLKMEVEEEEVASRGGGAAAGCMEDGMGKDRSDTGEQAHAGAASGTKSIDENGVTTLSRSSEPCSFPDSSAQFSGESCAPSSSCGEPLDSLTMGTGGDAEGDADAHADGVVATIFEEEEVEEEESRRRRRLQEAGGGQGGGERGEEECDQEEQEQWRGLAEEIIELSDEEERYLEEAEEEEEEDDDEDLVFVENGSSGGGGGGSNGIISITGTVSTMAPESGTTAPCKACGHTLPADSSAIRAHAQTHLTETGECRVCGAAFPELSASVTHALSHVGILLFSCDMCQTQFCSQSKLVRHRRMAASRYCFPTAEQLSALPHSPAGEFQCAVCTKHVAKDLKAVREHLLSHVCAQSLRCAVCQLPQPSLCALLWHCLSHLCLAAFSCPVCACSFLERPLLERHMALHAEVPPPTLTRGAGSGSDGGANGLEEDYRCFLCPQSFSSAAAFHAHLSAHAGGDVLSGGGTVSQGWATGIRKRKLDAGPDFTSSTSSSTSSGLPSSSSALDGVGGGGLGKLGLGFGLGGMGGVGMGMQDKMLQGGLPSFHSALLPNNNGSGGGGGGGISIGGITLGDGSVSGMSMGMGMGMGMGGMAPKQKWYRCRYCGKRFAHSGEFTYHLRIHTGEKPYQCKVCLRYFRGRSTMICHLKTHAGALMYRCTVCGQYFSTLKMVSSHMELHKEHLPPDFNIEQTFMYNDHSKEPLLKLDLP